MEALIKNAKRKDLISLCRSFGFRGYSHLNKKDLYEKVHFHLANMSDRKKASELSKELELGKLPEINEKILEWVQKLKKGDKVKTIWRTNESAFMEDKDGKFLSNIKSVYEGEVEFVIGTDVSIKFELNPLLIHNKYITYRLKISNRKFHSWRAVMKNGEDTCILLPEEIKKEYSIEERDKRLDCIILYSR